jgi:glycerol-3-phosphate O-acyltransferase/dihydroxyacetone phosphate acyltransferase
LYGVFYHFLGKVPIYFLSCTHIDILYFRSILNLPIVITAKALSAKKAKEALASSTVKIAGRDVLATWKFLVGLVLIPLLYGLYTLIVLCICLRSNLSWFHTILFPLMTWTLLPFVSYASMRFAENGVDVFK